MFSSVLSLTFEEEGQGMAEYALILALMVLLGAVGFTALGPSIKNGIESFVDKAYN